MLYMNCMLSRTISFRFGNRLPAEHVWRRCRKLLHEYITLQICVALFLVATLAVVVRKYTSY